MKKIKIDSYDELENLSITELEKNYFKKAQYKNYTYYFVRTIGYYGICLIVVANDKVIYIDEELQYNIKIYKTKTAIKDAMLKKMQSKMFNLDEFNIVTDYDEYLNKIDFLNNYYTKMYNSVSYYRTNEATPKQKKIIAKNYFADKISFCYFDNKEDLDRLNELHQQVCNAVVECLKDQDKKEQAILFELENHECFYTWELQPLGFLLAYGITANEIKQVFDKHLKEHKDLY